MALVLLICRTLQIQKQRLWFAEIAFGKRELKSYVARAVENYGALAIDTHDQKAPVKVTRAPAKPAQFKISQR